MTIAGQTVSDGMIYIGPRSYASEGAEISVIDPTLPVAASSAPAMSPGYWPTYSGISPAGRRRYLEWLSSGKQDPAIDIGYVLIYFYGLERRLILDAPGPGEMRALLAELHRLRLIYAAHQSFDGYSARLVEVVSYLLDPNDAAAVAAGQDVATWSGERPMAMTVAIAREIASERPLGCDLACATLFGLAEFVADLRLVKKAGRPALQSLLKARFTRDFPDGYKIRARKNSRLHLYYRGAAGGLQADIALRAGLQGLPDPATLKWTKLLAFGAAATRDMEAYAKELQYHPGRANSLAGLGLCPQDLRDQVASEARDWLKALPAPMAAVPFAELARHAVGKTGPRWSLRDHQQIVDTLSALGFGMEPDPARGKEHLEDTSVVQVFPTASDPHGRAMEVAFAAAALVLAVAHLDGGSGAAATERWLTTAPSRLALSPDQRLRLRAQVAWRASNCLTVPKALRMLGEATLEEREFCAWSAVEAALAAETLNKPQLAVLEHVHDKLDVVRSKLYAGLHAGISAAAPDAHQPVLMADEIAEALHPIAGPYAPSPMHIEPTQPPSERVSIVAHQDKSAEPFDLAAAEARLARIRADTQSVSALLADIFVEDDQSAAVPERAASGRFEGLDAEHTALLEDLLQRPSWPLVDFDAAAAAAGLMPGGAMETINEWAFDHLGDALLEDADPVVVNAAVFAALPEPAASA